MRKIGLLLIVGVLALGSCKKEESEPTTPPSNGTTAQTQTLPVYLSDIPLNIHFGGNPPLVRITESGTSNEFTFLVNTCASVNGNTFTITNGKSYSVVFGSYVDGQWAQWSGFSGSMTVAGDGQISGSVGAGNELGVVKSTNFGSCAVGTVIEGDILLFY